VYKKREESVFYFSNNNWYVINNVMKIITLTTTEQLKIFMQPTRQKILQTLSMKGPMTPKMVALPVMKGGSVSLYWVLVSFIGLLSVLFFAKPFSKVAPRT
jgi:hypothetical protein